MLHRDASLPASGKDVRRPAREPSRLATPKDQYQCYSRLVRWSRDTAAWVSARSVEMAVAFCPGQARTFGQRQSQSGACKDAQKR